MNERDELAQELCRADESTLDHERRLPEHPGGDILALNWERYWPLADVLLRHGWRKVDPAADTHTEWAVDHGEYGIGSAGAEDSARARAEHYRGYGAAVRLVSRTVTTGPWREVEQ